MTEQLTAEEYAFFTSGFTSTLLGAEFLEYTPGHVLLRCEIGDDHRNPMGGAHGGFLYSLMDTAAGAAGSFESAEKLHTLVTQGADIHFLRGPRGRFVTVEANTVKAGRSTCFITADAYDEDGTLLVRCNFDQFYITTTRRGEGTFQNGMWK